MIKGVDYWPTMLAVDWPKVDYWRTRLAVEVDYWPATLALAIRQPRTYRTPRGSADKVE